jgi:hypothetical protein
MTTGPDPTAPVQTRPEFSGEKPFQLGAGAGKTRILNMGAGVGVRCAYTRPCLRPTPYYLNYVIILIFDYIFTSLSFLT